MLSIIWDSKTEHITPENGLKYTVLTVICVHWGIKMCTLFFFVLISWQFSVVHILVSSDPGKMGVRSYMNMNKKLNIPVRKQLLVTRYTVYSMFLYSQLKHAGGANFDATASRLINEVYFIEQRMKHNKLTRLNKQIPLDYCKHLAKTDETVQTYVLISKRVFGSSTCRTAICVYWCEPPQPTKPTKWVCAQRRLRSAWASVQSDQSLRWALNG